MTRFKRGSRGEKQAQLEQNGYRVIGEGRYSVVLESPNTPGVIKLFLPEDTAYRSFINVAINNPNPHFPYFGPMVVTPLWCSVRMEKLSPLVDEKGWDHPAQVYLGCRGESNRALTCEDFGIKPYLEVANKPDLRMACDLIISELLVTFDPDFHGANFMMRGDDVVIIDPVACR